MNLRNLVVFVLLGSGSVAMAQLDRATLGGTISDSSGAVVPGARVEVLSEATGLKREAKATTTGAYTFPQLPIGTYNITASHAGLRTVTMKDVRLGVGDNRMVDIEMQVSGTETVVTVEGVQAALET